MGFFGDVFGGVKDAFSSVVDVGKSALGPVTDILKPVAGEVIGDVGGVLSWGKNVVSHTADHAANIADNFGKGSENLTGAVGDLLGNKWFLLIAAGVGAYVVVAVINSRGR